MKALRVTLAALFVFAPLHAGCNRKQAADGNAAPAPSVSAEQPQPEPQGAAGAPTDDARTLFVSGLQAYKENRDEEAIQHFKRAIELSPDFAEAYYRLGLAYNATKQPEEADQAFVGGAEAYEKITKQEPKNSDAYYFLGLCYEQIGKYDEAVKALKESVKNSPQENDDKYYELAAAHFKIAQYDEAVKALNKTLEIKPDHYPAQELLEQAKSGAARMAEFRKRQEQLRKQQSTGPNPKSSNSNASTGPVVNSNDIGPPPSQR
ncbi:MAG TPA: tetratricopeptide repeat protein [Pyrinomonadaceae bacterium]|jgi:tetratricopeptide (TPR) repeat protein